LLVVSLGERIRTERTRAGMTKTALARPRYTVSYISQIESGKRAPSAEAIAFLADRLAVTPSYLMTGVPDGEEDRLRFAVEDARLAMRDDRLDEAEATLLAAREDAERYGLSRARARARMALGDLRARTGRIREAIDLYEDCLEDDLTTREIGEVIGSLGRAYRRVGDLAYAADLLESHLARREEGPLDPGVAADLQAVLVSIYFERGDIVKAERTAARAIAAADEDTSAEIRARTYWDASRVLAESGRWDEALDLIARARALLEHLDDRRRLARIYNATAFLCLETDPPRTIEAAGHLDRAEAILMESGSAEDLAYVRTERGRVALLEYRYESAVTMADDALTLVDTDDLEAARALFVKGRALAELRRTREARGALEEAALLFAKHEARRQEASCWREVGELHLATGDMPSAVEALRSGLEALNPSRSRA
jgi:tetratricopeptide (TPR) repeat protein